MYSLAAYGEMLADPIRVRAYADALEATVRPGSTVLEIGTGPGIFALYAARLGARKVYAIEPDGVIQIARQLAREHGLAERIEWLQARSTEVELDERADLIVSDLRGNLPLFGDHVETIVDARERLLAPGGRLIPRRDVIHAAVVEAPELYRRVQAGFAGEPLGFDLSAAARMVLDSAHKARFEAEQCLTSARRFCELDYTRVVRSGARAELVFAAERPGTAHGYALWFDAELAPGIGFSTAPGQPELIYHHVFLPLARPLELAAGDRVDATLEVTRAGHHVWRWTTEHRPPRGEPIRIAQSTFQGLPLSPEQLRRRAADHRPTLGAEGEVLRFALARMDGEVELAALAAALRARFPRRFGDDRAALAYASDLSERYGASASAEPDSR